MTGTATANLSSLISERSSYNWDKDVENAYKAAGDTSTYATFVLNTGSGTTSNVYIAFGSPNIPQAYLAEPSFKITSVTMELTCRVTASSSYIRTSNCGAYEDRFGTVLVLSDTQAMSTTATTYTFDLGSDGYVKSELNQFMARFTATRGSTNPTNNYYIAVYGGTVTIEYEVDWAILNVSITNNTSATINAADEVDKGHDYILAIEEDLSAINAQYRTFGSTWADISDDFKPTFAIYSYPTGVTYTGTKFSPGYFTDVVDRPAGSTGSTRVDTNSGSMSLTDNYVEYSFDFSSIPNDAIINSISIQINYLSYNSSLGTYGSVYCQLYSGSTAKGNAVGLRSGDSIGTFIFDSSITPSFLSSWTRAELQNAKFRFSLDLCGRIYGITWTANCTRNSNYWYYQIFNVQEESSFQFDNAITHLITLSNSTSAIAAVNPNVIKDNRSGLVVVSTTTGIDILDNWTNINNQFEQSGVSVFPASYVVYGYINGERYKDAIGKGSDATPPSGNDWATSLNTDQIAIIRYNFDFSWIPYDAVISDVTVSVVGHREQVGEGLNNSYANIQLYSGDIAKGDKLVFSSTADIVYTMTPGTWTRQELLNANLRFQIGKYGGVIGGVTWTVSFSDNSYYYVLKNVGEDHIIIVRYPSALYYKSSDGWIEAARAFKKTNDGWVEQYDLTTVFDANTNYVNGQL